MDISSPTDLIRLRATVSPAEFRVSLRRYMLAHPTLALRQVAQVLGVTRQYVSYMVGPLARPTCAQIHRPAVKREEARRQMSNLTARVAAGESAEAAAKDLGISLPMAMCLGFRAKAVRPPHGTPARARMGCGCWRCRREIGLAARRASKAGAGEMAEVLDWLAYCDPETGQGLRQVEIGRLAGVGQGTVSRIARSFEGQEDIGA